MFEESRFERIKVRLEGAHYQPNGNNFAYIVGLSWDKHFGNPCIHLLYPDGEEDFIPLSELGGSKPLGSVTIVNGVEGC